MFFFCSFLPESRKIKFCYLIKEKSICPILTLLKMAAVSEL